MLVFVRTGEATPLMLALDVLEWEIIRIAVDLVSTLDDQDAIDAEPVKRVDAQDVPIDLDFVAKLGPAPELSEDESTDRVVERVFDE